MVVKFFVVLARLVIASVLVELVNADVNVRFGDDDDVNSVVSIDADLIMDKDSTVV